MADCTPIIEQVIETSEIELVSLENTVTLETQLSEVEVNITDTTLTSEVSSTTIETISQEVTIELNGSGGGAGVSDHLLLTNIGTNTHVQIDSHLSDMAELLPIFNGSTIHNLDPSVNSDGVNVTYTVTLSTDHGGPADFDVYIDSIIYLYEDSQSVSLVAGTDTAPVKNWVYITIIGGVATLGSSTTGFPLVEHAPLGTLFLQSPVSIQNVGPYILHAWNAPIEDEGTGHINHINQWVRRQRATWVSGGTTVVSITTNGGAPDNINILLNSAVVLQFHERPFQSHDTGTGELFYVANDFTTPYRGSSDMNEQLWDSTGDSMSGRMFSLVFWGVSSDDGTCKGMVNLPSGFYNKTDLAIEDRDNYADYSIPEEFIGVGFLMSRITFSHKTTASGTWVILDEESLLGKLPNTAAGSGGGAVAQQQFLDSQFTISNVTDTTKTFDTDASLITTGTTRTITMADEDIDLRPGFSYADPAHTHLEADITDLQAYILDITGSPLSELSNVTITSNTSGEILKWNGSIWINNTLVEAGIAPTVHNHTESDITDLQSYLLDITAEPLSDLSDVTITTIADGELLKWNGSIWINNTLVEAGIAPTVHTHLEADITDLQSYLLNITAEPLSDLTDVTVTAIASGELLKWNGSAWINNTLVEAGIAPTVHTHLEADITDLQSYLLNITTEPLEDLSDVTLTAISSGELLKWNGSAWINNTLAEVGISAVGHTHAVDDLSDVTITSVADDEIIVRDTGDWVNKTLAEAGVSATGHVHTRVDVTDISSDQRENLLINSDFSIAQRGTSQTTSGMLSIDRWSFNRVNGSATISQSAFTVAQTDVPFHPTNYVTHTLTTSGTASTDFHTTSQKIEDVNVLSGEEVTLNFWLEENGAGDDFSIEFLQNFGSGGSADVTAIGVTKFTSLGTGWIEYSVTVTIPSVSGKFVGVGNYTEVVFWWSAGTSFNSRTDTLGVAAAASSFTLANVQLMYGGDVLPFPKVDPVVELTRCERYYSELETEGGGVVGYAANGWYAPRIFYNTEMRVAPTITFTTFQIWTNAGGWSTAFTPSDPSTDTRGIRVSTATGGPTVAAEQGYLMRGTLEVDSEL